MRLLIQRVTRAEVRVRGERVGQIGRGLVVLVGVGHGDGPEVAEQMAGKCVDLRIFRDPEGKTNLALAEVAGEVLAVSQFTLFADTSRGRRPSFLDAAPPELGERLYERFAAAVEARGVRVARGVFGAEMEVELVNDGPLTIWLDSQAR
ncbi:MAG TPA: D-aminoacyl-tRNA deacylase [Candidatus Limnocylindrales bacterium]|jgi:D-aminoacyl-tRNA deacylase|nr:D-aminoacyl-tRNA deacylase [Candidatus Limnocylindrales bacterium]